MLDANIRYGHDLQSLKVGQAGEDQIGQELQLVVAQAPKNEKKKNGQIIIKHKSTTHTVLCSKITLSSDSTLQ